MAGHTGVPTKAIYRTRAVLYVIIDSEKELMGSIRNTLFLETMVGKALWFCMATLSR
jgi:hypothetical protein